MITTMEFKVGDFVEPKMSSRVQLASSCERYDKAICVSLEPFVLVSRFGDMMWKSHKSENFMFAGKPVCLELANVVGRLRRSEENELLAAFEEALNLPKTANAKKYRASIVRRTYATIEFLVREGEDPNEVARQKAIEWDRTTFDTEDEECEAYDVELIE